MLLLLSIVMLASVTTSLPIQEDCEESKYEFLDCLKATYTEQKGSYPDIKSAEAVVTQCGARESECDFQKRLIEVVEVSTNAMKVLGKVPNSEEFHMCSESLSEFSQICYATTNIFFQQKQAHKCLVKHAFESEVCTEKAAETYQEWTKAMTDGVESNTVLAGFLHYVTSMYKKDQGLTNQ